jgi:hypothetical protein
MVTLAVAPSGTIAQVPKRAPPSEPYLISVTRKWGRESSLGDLAMVMLPDSALELRLWGGFGLGGSWGLVLKRSRLGLWTARRVVVERCFVVVDPSDALSPDRLRALQAQARTKCRPSEMRIGKMITVDTLAMYPLPLPANPDSVWREVLRAGLLELPPQVRRRYMMRDGDSYVLEIRRGGEDYRASDIERGASPATPADTIMARVAELLTRAYRWR